MNTEQEKRHFSRFHIDGTTVLTHDATQSSTELLDLSLNGALCRQPLHTHLKIGTICSLSTTLINSDICINMQGHVVHQNSDIVGIRCDHIDLDSITHLKRLVELNLGDGSILERELTELGHMDQRNA